MTKARKPKAAKESRVGSKTEYKEAGIRIGVNQIVTYAGLVPIFWFILQPIIVDALAEEMQQSIKQTVASEVEPINDAFVVLLNLDINNLKREIARLEFRQSQGDEWTAADAQALAELRIELDALEAAMAALEDEEDES